MEINELPAFLEKYNKAMLENPIFAGDRWSVEVLFGIPEPFRLMHHGKLCTFIARTAPTFPALIEKMKKELEERA